MRDYVNGPPGVAIRWDVDSRQQHTVRVGDSSELLHQLLLIFGPAGTVGGVVAAAAVVWWSWGVDATRRGC